MGIEVTRDNGGIATVLINRPEKRNALTWEMYQALGDAFGALNDDPTIRCVILRGAGGHFCAGSDIQGFEEDRLGRQQARRYADFTLSMTDIVRDCVHPTIACIEGICVGGGLEIAAMCDIRIAGRGSRFGVPANRLGLTLEYRELYDLAKVIGYTATLEILLEGQLFDAERALHIGLVTSLADDADVTARTHETAQNIASAAPLSNRWHKKFLRKLRLGNSPEILDIEECYDCFDTEDYRLGTQSFIEKSVPKFVGR